LAGDQLFAEDQPFASPLGTRTTSKDEKTEDKRRRFEKWREWEPGKTTEEQLEQPKEPEWFLRLAGDDSLDTAMARATTLNSEATGSEATGLDRTGLAEVTSFDITVTDTGMAGEVKAAEFKARMEATG
jgi:hypothetical protein